MITGCFNDGYYKDGYCDDYNNNEACFFDGGDCCGSNVNTEFCTQCLCLEEEGGGSGGTTTPYETTTSCFGEPSWIADGNCDDITNYEGCFFDGGDCCGSNVNTQYCTQCLCLEEEGGGGIGGTTTAGACNQGWIGDMQCDDINNNLDCIYDGGDCCGPNVNTQYCYICQCLEEDGGGSGGTTTPYGTTTSCFGDSSWIADGICDDITNYEGCFFDGGDCCGSNVNTQFCTQCLCLEEEGGGGSGGTTTAGACNQSWIGDGYCDDINNNLDCSFDGGDCCGLNVNTLYCTVCQCLEGGGEGSGGTLSGTG